MATQRRYRLQDGRFVWREIEQEAVVLDMATSRYLSVNATGTLLWRSLESGATEGQLVDMLVDRCAVDADTARRGVAAFLADLEARAGLVTG